MITLLMVMRELEVAGATIKRHIKEDLIINVKLALQRALTQNIITICIAWAALLFINNSR